MAMSASALYTDSGVPRIESGSAHIFFLIASGGANCKYHDQLQLQWSKDSLPEYLNVKLVSYSPPLSYFSYFTLKVI